MSSVHKAATFQKEFVKKMIYTFYLYSAFVEMTMKQGEQRGKKLQLNFCANSCSRNFLEFECVFKGENQMVVVRIIKHDPLKFQI